MPTACCAGVARAAAVGVTEHWVIFFVPRLLRGGDVSRLHLLQAESKERSCISICVCEISSIREILLGLPLHYTSFLEQERDRVAEQHSLKLQKHKIWWGGYKDLFGWKQKECVQLCETLNTPSKDFGWQHHLCGGFLWNPYVQAFYLPVATLLPVLWAGGTTSCFIRLLPSDEPSTCASCLLWPQLVILLSMQRLYLVIKPVQRTTAGHATLPQAACHHQGGRVTAPSRALRVASLAKMRRFLLFSYKNVVFF